MRECKARIVVRVDRPKDIVRALEPDNEESPPWLKVSCHPLDEIRLECLITVECTEPMDLLRLRHTVDDLLANIKAAIEALSGL